MRQIIRLKHKENKLPLNEKQVWVLITILTALIFIIDVLTPLGIAIGILYIFSVLLSSWLSGRLSTILISIVCTALVLLGIFFSPQPEPIDYYSVIANRFLSILSIWFSAFYSIRLKSVDLSLRESELKFNALFNSASEAIIVSNEKGEIILSSKRAQELFGYTGEEIQKLFIEALVPEKFLKNHSELRRQYNQSPKTRIMGQGMELHARKKDGTEFPVEISLSFVKKKDGILVTSFVLDITRRKLAEDALHKANQELENFALQLKRSNVDLEQFAYVASHDLQEPLRKIQAFGGIILSEESGKLSIQGKDYFSRIQNAAGRMQKLINDLLSFSRITSQAEPFTKVNLNQTINDVLIDMEVSIKNANAKIEVDLLPEIEASPLQMRQLFQNLIVNSIKFKQESVAPFIHIKNIPVEIISNKFKNQMIELRFIDNGKGFDEKYSEKIFNLFQRLDNTYSEGSGIGLAVCKKIVTRHSGTITAQSKVGEGAVFVIKLPVSQNQ